jgi:TolB-like protein
MKKAIKSLFVLLFFILIVSVALAAEKNNKPKIKTVDNYIAIFDLEVRTGDKSISGPLTDTVIHQLSQSDKYEVIDRGNMNKILEEQKFQMSGCVAQECIVEAGQILGVGKIVTGAVGIVGKTYYLTLQLIDVQTGKIELSVDDTCKCEVDELLRSIKRLSKKLLGEKIDERVATVATPKQQELQTTNGEITRDGRFIAYNNGTVLDTRTNLMWAAKDNGSDLSWADGNSFCKNYRAGGYTDWRIPTRIELEELYQTGRGYKATQRSYEVYLTKLIQLSTCCPWVLETDGSAAHFSLNSGKMRWDRQSGGDSGRALPVRSVK